MLVVTRASREQKRHLEHIVCRQQKKIRYQQLCSGTTAITDRHFSLFVETIKSRVFSKYIKAKCAEDRK